MNEGDKMGHRRVSRRVVLPLELLLLVSGGVGLALSSPAVTLRLLALWVVLALVYVAMIIRRLDLAMHSPALNRELLPDGDVRDGRFGSVLPLDVTVIGFSSAMGMISAITIPIGAVEGGYGDLARFLSPLGILLAWVLLHLGFSRLYANNWAREGGDGGIRFPGTDQPGLIEFTHFAFSVGASLQSPTLTTSRMRLLVTAHTVISFLYASVLIGFIVALIPSG